MSLNANSILFVSQRERKLSVFMLWKRSNHCLFSVTPRAATLTEPGYKRFMGRCCVCVRARVFVAFVQLCKGLEFVLGNARNTGWSGSASPCGHFSESVYVHTRQFVSYAGAAVRWAKHQKQNSSAVPVFFSSDVTERAWAWVKCYALVSTAMSKRKQLYWNRNLHKVGQVHWQYCCDFWLFWVNSQI